MSKVTSRKYNSVMVPYGAHSGARKLDTYLGYTEDLVAICARISNLSFLSSNPHALVLEISAMSVLSVLNSWVDLTLSQNQRSRNMDSDQSDIHHAQGYHTIHPLATRTSRPQFPLRCIHLLTLRP